LLALCIDVLLLKHESSLSKVMLKMWTSFGKPSTGYEINDFETAVFEEFPDQIEIKTFFTDFVNGYQDFFPTLKSLLDEIGILLEERLCGDWLQNDLGIRTSADGMISQLHPDSKAFFTLMRNDRILSGPVEKSVDSTVLSLQIARNGRIMNLAIPSENGNFFPDYQLSQKETKPITERWRA
jgi:predicted metalloprotease with PDZ domain